MKVNPLHDRVLVRRVVEAESTSLIVIPDTAKEKPMEGEVVAVGRGRINERGERVAMDVQAGDRILFGKYSGNEIKVEDQELLILREDEILATLTI